jgi:hypothetical protein
MPDERNDKFLDELLDASLRHYSDAAPRERLEGRVLAQLRSARAARSQRRWVWALAVGVAATVVIIAGIAIHKPVPVRPMTASQHASEPQPKLTRGPVGPGLALAKATPRGGPTHTKNLAGKTGNHGLASQLAEAHWPAQFPTPAPLSEQEKLLLAYARWMASSAQKNPAVEEQQDNLEIPLLTITALNISPLEGEKDNPEK